MCPLRVILIFLSATIAGLLVLKNFKSVGDVDINSAPDSPKPKNSSPSSCKDKVMSVVSSGFWTVVDMASGRYLWRFFAAGAGTGTPKSS